LKKQLTKNGIYLETWGMSFLIFQADLTIKLGCTYW
jgi:hypothetical protein